MHHNPGREGIRQGWCLTRPGRKVRPLKQTLIPMVERVTTRTVGGRYVKLRVPTGLHLHTFRTRLEQAYRHEDT